MVKTSWLFSDHRCQACGYNICVTQSVEADYWYYCTNKKCANHEGEEIFDDEDCSFGERIESSKD